MSQAPGGPHKRPSPGPSTSSLAERRRIACHLCRSRKTRCDNQRPPCGYCAMNGTACAYPDEPSHPPDAVVSNAAIMDRLNHAISLLERADHVPDQQAEAEAEPSAPPSAFADDGFGRVEISDAAARVSSCEAVLRWPVLQGMGCVKDTPASFGLEAAAAGCVQQQQGAAPQDDMLQLCQRFLALVHIKNPILDAGEFTRQARHAAEYGPGWDAGGCAVLLACALASVAAPYHPTEGGHARQASLEDTQAAEAYFGAAQRRIGLLPPSLVAVQCHYLAGLYAKFAVRPMQAWSLMQAASAQLQALLYAKGLAVTQDTDDTLRARHIEQRLYWSCVKAESELRIELQLPSLGRAKYPGLFPSLSFPSSSDLHPLDDTPSQAPTPWSSAAWQNSPDTPRTGLLPEEERSWLHYLAEISLRSLMSRVLAGLYGAEAASWPSMSGLERLQDAYIDQVDEWHATLPPQLAFDRVLPLRQHDHFRPSNELSFFLQTRHTGVLEWIYRPSLYIVLHADRPCQQHVSLASQALGAAVALIKIVAAHHRHGGIWQWLRRSFGAALTLIAAAVHSHRATLQGPSACRLDVPRDWAALVRLSMATLRDWGGGQTVDLARMEGILRDLLTAALADINT